ncbi:MAG: topology modulation protein [Alphaproteobacteria bacterium]|nr:topology modulation protein [Alphaproteobacteria bacterium]
MRRIVILGCSGGGKSTLARALGARLGLPVVHLDVLFWQPGWKESERAPFRARLADALAGDGWITDGNFANTFDLRLPRADTIIWIEQPRLLCVARALLRVARYYGRNRPDLAPGCPERLDLAFLRYIWRFRRDTEPKVWAGIAAHGGHARLVRLAGNRAIAAFLASVAPDTDGVAQTAASQRSAGP